MTNYESESYMATDTQVKPGDKQQDQERPEGQQHQGEKAQITTIPVELIQRIAQEAVERAMHSAVEQLADRTAARLADQMRDRTTDRAADRAEREMDKAAGERGVRRAQQGQEAAVVGVLNGFSRAIDLMYDLMVQAINMQRVGTQAMIGLAFTPAVTILDEAGRATARASDARDGRYE